MPEKPKLNIGVVGAGARGLWVIGHEMARRTRDARVLAFCDPRPDLEKDVAWVETDVLEKHGPLDYRMRAVSTLDELLAIPEIQMVFLATPDHLHAEYAERILEAGRDLLIEKPMATTVEDLNRIVAAQQRTGRRVFVGFCMRYNALHARAKELVAAGTIGRPCTISFQDYFARGRGYFRGRGRFRKYTGGLLTEKACHSFDLMAWILGAEPVRVSCFGGTLVFRPDPEAALHCSDCKLVDSCPDAVRLPRDDSKPSVSYDHDYGQAHKNGGDLCVYNSDKDNEDTDVMLLDFSTGVLGTYVECFYSPTVERRYSIVGTRGELQASEELGTIRMCRLGEGVWTEEKIVCPPGSHRGADPAMVTAAIQYFTGNGDADTRTVDAWAGRLSVLTALAAQRSCDEERVVYLTDLSAPGILCR
jgi:predicted dehydrogenase